MLHEVVREEYLAAGLVPGHVVHAQVCVRAVGAAGGETDMAVISLSAFFRSNPTEPTQILAYPLVQFAAVNTHSLEMRVPPQNHLHS